MCQAARLFVNRILATLREAPEQGYVKLSDEFHKDINWFNTLLRYFNGTVFFNRFDIPAVTNIYLDASLIGVGGVWNNKVYQWAIPKFVNMNISIVHLEMINLLVALRLWYSTLCNSKLILYCDNMAVVSVLNTGKGYDALLLAIARNIWLTAASANIANSIHA